MKLYYKPGACSLSPHIVLREAGVDFSIEKVDLVAKTTEHGADYLTINPKGQVPALQLDDGSILTENAVIVQYLADQKPDRQLLPAAGSLARYHALELLNFIATELHKGFSPLFNPRFPEEAKEVAREQLRKKLAYIDGELAGKEYLLGSRFSVADAYLFTILNWARVLKFNLDLPNLTAFMARMAARPAVDAALAAEGLK
ncbi:glutathione transferase GstA [Nissabacter sp. SGAir0207]|uniref:glutathione transferase GstA n=1 Tax=Nissabacter sp. SGAir0207 TaxID=2126321 RepID=UPI0010CD65C9|nr:glutathione transferase GstA [Nissabacter sp. SGAir0207]QCR36263.1 glutathione transferase GstA [Nissabacter sp. SGAir0207]